jgi:anti-sigma B factor antagonist
LTFYFWKEEIKISSEKLTIRENNDIRIIDVDGDLDSYTAVDLRKELEGLQRQRNYKIVVNLSKVEYINSTAVGALVGTAKQVRRKNGDLKIYGLAENLQRTFDLVGASKVVELYDSENEAVASF